MNLNKVSFINISIIFSVLLAFTLLLASPTYANLVHQDKKSKTEATSSKSATKKESAVKETEKKDLVCIVTGEEADPNLKMEYKGKTYYFCCKKCVKKFKENPEKYIKS